MKNYIAIILFLLFWQNLNAQSGLWGTTYTGGAGNNGTIFKVNLGGSGYTAEHTFDYSTGWSSGNDLCLAADGKLYGTTEEGGLYNYGVIYSFDPVTNTYSNAYNFNDTIGAISGLPSSNLITENFTA